MMKMLYKSEWSYFKIFLPYKNGLRIGKTYGQAV